jgi:hypothetical protein
MIELWENIEEMSVVNVSLGPDQVPTLYILYYTTKSECHELSEGA